MKNILIGFTFILVIGLGILAVLGSLSSTDKNANSSNKEVLQEDGKDLDMMPAFSLEDIHGDTINSDSLLELPLVVNMWATTCPFCKHELPDFVSLQEEFKDKITVVAIDRGERLDKILDYTNSVGVTDGIHFLLDPDDSYYPTIGGFGMPETLFVNSEGQIVVHKRGPMTIEEMRTHVSKIIKK